MKNGVHAALGAFALAALLVACGGGGGGGGTTPPTGGGGSGSGGSGGGGTTTTPTPSSSPSISGSLAAGSGTTLASGSTLTVTCGCTGEAGETTLGSGGTYAIPASLTAIPSSPAPYQLVPGRNYLIIGYQTGSALQAWTMEFVGNTPANNLNLSSSPSNTTANASDLYSTAAALYIYREASELQQHDTDQTFDLFNFNTIAGWAAHLRTQTGLTTAETKFLADISSAQASPASLFPGAALPAWDPNASTYGLNPTITSDIDAIASAGISADATLPTPCPGGAGSCTGTPNP